LQKHQKYSHRLNKIPIKMLNTFFALAIPGRRRVLQLTAKGGYFVDYQ